MDVKALLLPMLQLRELEVKASIEKEAKSRMTATIPSLMCCQCGRVLAVVYDPRDSFQPKWAVHDGSKDFCGLAGKKFKYPTFELDEVR